MNALSFPASFPTCNLKMGTGEGGWVGDELPIIFSSSDNIVYTFILAVRLINELTVGMVYSSQDS